MQFDNKLKPSPQTFKLYHRSPESWDKWDPSKVGSNESATIPIDQTFKPMYGVLDKNRVYDPNNLSVGAEYGENLYELELDGKLFPYYSEKDQKRTRYGDQEGDLSVDQLIDLIWGPNHPQKDIQQGYIYGKTTNLPNLLETMANASFSKLKGKTGMEILELLGYSGYTDGWETIANPSKIKQILNKSKVPVGKVYSQNPSNSRYK
jgi:hypothetical protein